MVTVTASQAKNSLLELLRDVMERGETVQITRNGIPGGVLVSAEEWESLLETVAILSDPAAMKRIARARRESGSGVFLTHENVWGADAVPVALPARSRKRHPGPAGRRGGARPKSRRAARR